MAQPSYYLTPQQIQTLQYLQQNQASLTANQQNMLHELQQRYRMMQQHQNQLRQQQRSSSVATVRPAVQQFGISGQTPQTQFGNHVRQPSTVKYTSSEVKIMDLIKYIGIFFNEHTTYPSIFMSSNLCFLCFLLTVQRYGDRRQCNSYISN